MVKDDFIKNGKHYDDNMEDYVVQTQKKVFKRFIKNLAKNATFQALTNMQQSHTKVKDIKYNELKSQEYLTSGIFTNEEISILSSLRSHTLRTIKCNFKHLYVGNLNCPLLCTPEGKTPYDDTQKHLIACNIILGSLSVGQKTIAVNTIKYEDIYSENIYKQKAIVSLVIQCINIRNSLLENSKRSTSGQPTSLDPSTSVCCVNTDSSVYIGTE